MSRKADQANTILADCMLCPRQCRINRLNGQTGYCRTNSQTVISSYLPHQGEEPFLSGSQGSGTIFFANCNLQCQFCQNYQISQQGNGSIASPADMAQMMLALQDQGCHNLNLVSPTHVVPAVLKALILAIEKGFRLPLVYNTNGYESLETLKLLEGVVDIYLPDIKYSQTVAGDKYSLAPAYPAYNQPALLEMYRQVGNVKQDESGLAIKGMVIRHLVLPQDLSGSLDSIRFLAANGLQNTWISVMAQYHPTYRAHDYPELNRPITEQEYDQVVSWFEEYGFYNLWTQRLESRDIWVPDFTRDNPFDQK